MSDLFGQPEPVRPERAFKSAVVYRDPTEREWQIAKALEHVAFPVAHPHKRFAREIRQQLDFRRQLTDKQADYLCAIAWRYRRQMPAHLAYPITEEEIERYRVDLVGK